MRRIRMAEFGLTPTSDFSKRETRESFYYYCSALRRQALEQSVKTNELIPASAIWSRLENEFGKSQRYLNRLWVEMSEELEPEDDEDVEVIDLDDAVDEETANSFRAFIEMKIRERAEEEELFAFLQSPAGTLSEHDDA